MLTSPIETEKTTPPVPMFREVEARLVKDEPEIPVYYDVIQVDNLLLSWWKRHQKYFFLVILLTASGVMCALGNRSKMNVHLQYLSHPQFSHPGLLLLVKPILCVLQINHPHLLPQVQAPLRILHFGHLLPPHLYLLLRRVLVFKLTSSLVDIFKNYYH